MGAGQSKDNHAVGSNGASELSTSEGESACPVPESLRVKAVYNVYNQRIDELPLAKTDVLDPSNNMPAEPNQQPSPGQKKLISTQRVVSNIPKGNTESTWVYPSPQMFFNGVCGLGRLGTHGPAAAPTAVNMGQRNLCATPAHAAEVVTPLPSPLPRPQPCVAKERATTLRRTTWIPSYMPTTA